jgi:hypothetical protein
MYYTKIVLSCPKAAKPGETVNVKTEVTNISSELMWISTFVIVWDKTTGAWERPIMEAEWIQAGETKEYTGSFTMFERDVDIGAYTYVGEVILDNEVHKTVKAGEAYWWLQLKWWEWAAIGGGVAVAIGTGVALSRKKR